jgi:quercetin dioxygenase-like cupin family protein
MKHLIVAALVTLVGAVVAEGPADASARAAEAAEVLPHVVKPVLDNPRVRVVEIDFKPGGNTGKMVLSDHMLYMLTNGSLVFDVAGKTPYQMTLSAGQALWLPATTGGLENASDSNVRLLIVEVKSAAARTSRQGHAHRER